MKAIINWLKKKTHVHDWEYRSGGVFDIYNNWGSRFRSCQCGVEEVFDDFLCDYSRIKQIKENK